MKQLTTVACLIVASLILNAPAFANDVQQNAAAATVMVQGKVGNMYAIGAGVVLKSGDGLTILTALHVTQHDALEVVTADGQHVNVLSVTPVPGYDLAIIKTATLFGIFKTVQTASAPNDGAAVFVVGTPHGNGFTVSNGNVLSTTPTFPDGPANGRLSIQCETCAVGDSGGGVFNSDGKLIGILTAAYSNNAGKVVMIEVEPWQPATALASH